MAEPKAVCDDCGGSRTVRLPKRDGGPGVCGADFHRHGTARTNTRAEAFVDRDLGGLRFAYGRPTTTAPGPALAPATAALPSPPPKKKRRVRVARRRPDCPFVEEAAVPWMRRRRVVVEAALWLFLVFWLVVSYALRYDGFHAPPWWPWRPWRG